jgi:predicted DNA-binding transcriptional regulator YafY
VEEVKGGTHFSIEVIPNFEMERELIGFGEGIKILSPNNIVRQIKRKVRLMAALYETGQE